MTLIWDYLDACSVRRFSCFRCHSRNKYEVIVVFSLDTHRYPIVEQELRRGYYIQGRFSWKEGKPGNGHKHKCWFVKGCVESKGTDYTWALGEALEYLLEGNCYFILFFQMWKQDNRPTLASSWTTTETSTNCLWGVKTCPSCYSFYNDIKIGKSQILAICTFTYSWR